MTWKNLETGEVSHTFHHPATLDKPCEFWKCPGYKHPKGFTAWITTPKTPSGYIVENYNPNWNTFFYLDTMDDDKIKEYFGEDTLNNIKSKTS